MKTRAAVAVAAGKPVEVTEVDLEGCSTFSNFTVLPEIAVAKVNSDAPFDKICYIGCGVTTGDRRRAQHR